MGHVSPAMTNTYSDIRRKALDQAAASLQPFVLDGLSEARRERRREKRRYVSYDSASTSSVTVVAQSEELEHKIDEIAPEIGSSGWIRTSNPPVNRRTRKQR